MKRLLIIAAFFALLFLAGHSALAQSGYDIFQKGLVQERTEGNLKEAIRLYKQVIAEHKDDRALVAKALVQMGGCYEKLGQTEAQNAYQRVIQEFAEQQEQVAIANERLAEMEQDNNKSEVMMRQVWAPAKDTMGMPSPNGRYLSFVHWNNRGNLAVHDLKTGENRDLTDEGTWETPSQFCDVSIWSPDSNQIAYCWCDTGNGTDLRIVGLDGSEPRILYHKPELGFAWPRAWSHDGKYILAILCNSDVVEASEHIDKIALVSVVDGSLQILKTLGNRRCRYMEFSPDDRTIVFDVETAKDSGTHDIYLLAVDGSREIPLVIHPANDGSPFWTPDGKGIIFTSDRSGSQGLWMLSLEDGKPKGTPALIKEMGSHFDPMGFIPNGALYYSIGTPALDVYVTTLDFEKSSIITPSTKKSLRFEGQNYAPCWSPDGKYMAYASQRDSDNILVIHSVETGKEKDISPDNLRVLQNKGKAAPQWSPDGKSVLVTGMDKMNNHGLYLIEVETGNITTILQDNKQNRKDNEYSARWPVFSSDGKQIYYIRGRSIVIHNLATHGESILHRAEGYLYRLAISPDGQLLAFLEANEAIKPTLVKTVSISNGETHEIFTLPEGNRFSWGVGLTWMPDGNHMIVGAPDAINKPDELWIIPVSGGEYQKLELGFQVKHLSLHPDGRRIAYTLPESETGEEVWVMENVLPETETTE